MKRIFKRIIQSLRSLWQDMGGGLFITGVALGFVVGFWGGYSRTGQLDGWFIDGFWPEALGIVFTVFVIDTLNRSRDERNRERDLKDSLVREAGSISNETAKNAISELRKRHWLEEGSSLLTSQNLQNANLAGADLRRANLTGTVLVGVNMSAANLGDSNLTEANLSLADLSDADLYLSNLSGTNLFMVNFSGSDLREAVLTKAKINQTTFDENTILPNGKKWTPDTDLTIFGAEIELTSKDQ